MATPNYTVLIIEDEKNISDFMSKALKSNGYRVITAVSGKAGLSLISSQCPDIILLDLGLPDIEGNDVITSVRKWTSCPIIVVSARTGERDKVSALDLGADDYITKPFKNRELMARVKSQLRRYHRYNPARSDSGEAPYNVQTDTIICGELTMNVKAHTCILDEKPLVLTPTEFSILRILLENAGNVVSSEELFHKIWQDEYYSKSNNTITVHIRHLREKLGDSMDKPRFIKTIWGVGYKIEN